MNGLWAPGEPGLAPWRAALSAMALDLPAGCGLRLDYTLRDRRWIDLDTLVERTIRTLRAGALVDAVVATKRWGGTSGMRLRVTSAAAVARLRPPGPAALDVSWPDRVRDRDGKAAFRDAVAAAWAPREPLEGTVWAELRSGPTRSLLGGSEAALDCLEPVLGRDPRGRDWQEFFPFDDRIVWLRLSRHPHGAPVRLRLGPI